MTAVQVASTQFTKFVVMTSPIVGVVALARISMMLQAQSQDVPERLSEQVLLLEAGRGSSES